MKRQKKVSLSSAEMEIAKIQAQKDGFGNNATGWIRWLIRSRAVKSDNPATPVEA